MSNSAEWNYAVVPLDSETGWGPFSTREHAELWATCKLGGVDYMILQLTRLPSMAESREDSR